MRKTLLDMEQVVKLKMNEINAPDYLLPTFSDEEGDARDSHPLVLDNVINYKYVVYERGKLILERVTKDLNELYFWIFSSITSNLSFTYAASFCQDDEQRIYAFKRQMELLEKVEVQEPFIVRLKNEYNKVLGYELFSV